MGQKLTEAWGQQVVIDNRPGAGGNQSAEIAARAAPDGYTLYMCSASLVVNVSLYRKVPYDPLRDFAPITLLGSVHNVLVTHPSVPAQTVSELVALARKTPGRMNYASPGNGTSGHLSMELFKSLARIDVVHVPYKTIGQAQADVLGGQVPMFFPSIPGALPHIRAGRINALATSGAKRAIALPNVPTVAEAGVAGYEASTWYPVLAPARTPQALVQAVNRQIVTVLETREVRDQLTQGGVEPIGSSPVELTSHMQAELGKWAKVIRAIGLRLD